MKLSKAAPIFIQSLQDIGLSKHTIKSYNTDLNQFIDIIGKETDLDEITYPNISEYFSYLQGKKLATSSLKRKRVVVKRFLSFAYEKRLCTNDNSKLIDPMKSRRNTKPKNILTVSEINKIEDFFINNINSLKNPKKQSEIESLYIAYRNQLLVSILLYTGCRAQEAVSIKKSDISLENNFIGIWAKGSKFNNVPIHNKLKNQLEDYYSHMDLFNKIEHVKNNNTYLFPSRVNKNNHISTRTLYDLMIVLSDLLGRNIHAHLFRHTFASYAIASGMNVGALSSIISHSSPAITLSIYTHEIEERQKQEEIKKLHFDF